MNRGIASPTSARRVSSYEQAAHKLRYLMSEARKARLSGVNLKDEAEALPKAGPASADNFLIES